VTIKCHHQVLTITRIVLFSRSLINPEVAVTTIGICPAFVVMTQNETDKASFRGTYQI